MFCCNDSVLLMIGKSAGSSMKTPSGEFLMNQFSEPSQATSKHSSQSALHSAAKPNEKSLKKNRAVDTHIPAMNVTAERTSTGNASRVNLSKNLLYRTGHFHSL